jgi:predicted transcriptional regulator
MTKLLEQAIEDLKKLPESDQDEAADFLFNLMRRREQPIVLDDETRAAVQEGLAQARRGEFASDEEMEAFFARHRA